MKKLMSFRTFPLTDEILICSISFSTGLKSQVKLLWTFSFSSMIHQKRSQNLFKT